MGAENHATASITHENQLIEQARGGDITGLIAYLYTRFYRYAKRLSLSYQHGYDGLRLDAEDITQEGIERALRSLRSALAGDHPIAQLLYTGKYRMLDFCQEHRASIRVPARSQRQGKRIPCIASLDAPLPNTEGLTLLDVLAESKSGRKELIR
jgi:DNA-directed RNA polymerase specialized sigma24 family protein